MKEFKEIEDRIEALEKQCKELKKMIEELYMWRAPKSSPGHATIIIDTYATNTEDL